MRAATLIGLLLAHAPACNGESKPPPGDDAGTDPDASRDDAGDAGDAAVEGWPDVPVVPPPDVLLDGLRSPCGIAVGPEGIHVVEQGAGRVLLVPLEGGEPEEVAGDLASPRLIALGDDAIFVTEQETGAIARIDVGVTRLVTDQVNLGRIRVRDGWVYFLETGEDGEGAAVSRVPVEGGDVEDLATDISPPRGLDVSSTRCYFTGSTSREVAWVPTSGGVGASIVDDDTGTPIDVRVDEEAGEVYWLATGSGRWVHRADLDLGRDARLSFSPGGPSWLALDETHVYWSIRQAILRAPREGTDVPYEDVAVQTSVCDLVVHDGVVYWTDHAAGRLLRHVP